MTFATSPIIAEIEVLGKPPVREPGQFAFAFEVACPYNGADLSGTGRRDREDQMTPGGIATQADQTARNSRLLQFGCMAFFLVNGALVLLTSSLLVFLMQDYNLTYDQGGLLLTIQAVGNIATSFLSGPLALRIGRKRTLILAALGFSLSLGLVALARLY
jgi:Na+/melibiose symporter-like transporter